jgi:hypothetical protein
MRRGMEKGMGRCGRRRGRVKKRNVNGREESISTRKKKEDQCSTSRVQRIISSHGIFLYYCLFFTYERAAVRKKMLKPLLRAIGKFNVMVGFQSLFSDTIALIKKDLEKKRREERAQKGEKRFSVHGWITMTAVYVSQLDIR